jgi:hypothetical protein
MLNYDRVSARVIVQYDAATRLEFVALSIESIPESEREALDIRLGQSPTLDVAGD